MVETSRGESSKCDNFPESGNTPRMQWPALPLINRFRSSKRTPVECLARLFNLRKSIDSDPGRRMLWQNAANLLPKSDAATFNSALLDLGALICVARKPKCGVCPVKTFCRAKNPAALPVRKSRPETKQLIEKHALIVRRGRILLEQSRRRWRGMWILPPLEPDCLEQPRFQRRPVYESVFPFTHHRVTLSVYRRARQSESLPDSIGLDRSKRSQCLRLTGARSTRSYETTPISQCNMSSTKVPATVVRIVMGMPNRA